MYKGCLDVTFTSVTTCTNTNIDLAHGPSFELPGGAATARRSVTCLMAKAFLDRLETLEYTVLGASIS